MKQKMPSANNKELENDVHLFPLDQIKIPG